MFISWELSARRLVQGLVIRSTDCLDSLVCH